MPSFGRLKANEPTDSCGTLLPMVAVIVGVDLDLVFFRNRF